MKKRMFTYLALLCIAFTTANASEIKPAKKVNMTKPSAVIDAFIEAQVKGDVSLFDQVLANELVMKVNRPGSINFHTKENIMTYYGKNADVLRGYQPNYEILSSSKTAILARVDLKFASFIQQNFVALEKDSLGEWKITQLNRFNKAI
ncbi:hypothetical protein VRU48_02365 [Pedobacter sp. KR3-3]|uniref:DUF4440 domain-containing protein n=1 Tax=Pedobacter albus TaxID=3113905 RepID=A0ABU7I391_9SPHI|nr:hypothetical protein [Pedobacter sp. KR3-3]MEE1943934.1 hypothetical protein [Pedobacter sp. KR3-3]